MDTATAAPHGIYVYSLPLSFLLGAQYMLLAVVSVVFLPLQVLHSFSLLPDDAERGAIIARILFISGLATLAQSLFGARWPLCIAPSALFIGIGCDLLHSQLWEKYSDGDLYAMGAALRRNEFLARTTELQGTVILSSFITSIIFGVLFYLRVRPSPISIQSTIISLSTVNVLSLISNITQLDFAKSLLFQMPFFLLMLFFVAQNLTVPFLKVITTEDHKIRIKIFKLFPVLLTFIAGAFVNIYFELDYDFLLDRASDSYSWFSFNYLPKDFNFPVISLRGLMFLPSLLSQSLASYCCYAFIIGDSSREIGALLVESASNVLSSSLGVFLPLSLDTSSLGLYTLTQVKNTETTAISGSLLLVMASFLKVVALTSYTPPLLLAPIYIYLHAHLIATVLAEVKSSSSEHQKVLVISVMAALGLSSFSPPLDSNIFHNISTTFLRNPVILTFIFSMILSVPNRKAANNTKSVIQSAV